MIAPDPFFDGFRSSLGRLSGGLIRVGVAASAALLKETEKQLGRPLPSELSSFLTSWNGVDLFAETLVILAAEDLLPHQPQAGPRTEEANACFRAGDLVFATAGPDERFVLSPGMRKGQTRVFRVLPGSEERWLAGSSFTDWLNARIAHEAVLYDDEGEYAEDAIGDDAGTITPLFALRQAERGLKKDSGAADLHHERGLAARALGKELVAVQAFLRATELDKENPWPWFELARTWQAQGQLIDAAAAYDETCKRLGEGATVARMRALQARALLAVGDAAGSARAREQALALNPRLPEQLAASQDEAMAADDAEAYAEAETLRAALVPETTPQVRRLPVISDRPSARAARDLKVQVSGTGPRKPPRDRDRASKPRPSKRRAGPSR